MTVVSRGVAYGPWRCPFCGRATVTMYRCSNWDCAKDLTAEDLDPIEERGRA